MCLLFHGLFVSGDSSGVRREERKGGGGGVWWGPGERGGGEAVRAANTGSHLATFYNTARYHFVSMRVVSIVSPNLIPSFFFAGQVLFLFGFVLPDSFAELLAIHSTRLEAIFYSSSRASRSTFSTSRRPRSSP